MREGLCCCEYIDSGGERSHIIASFCNCDAIDEACDRLFTCHKLHSDLCNEIFSTISDRLRIPWIGGAKKVSIYAIFAWLTLTFIIILGSLNILLTFIIYVVITPCIVYTIHRYIKNQIFSYYIYSSKSFYFSWFLFSILITFYSIFNLIFSTLKITSTESLIFTSLCVFSSCCFYIVINKSKLKCKVENFNYCHSCSSKSPKESSHCRYCNSCFLLRDHHCLWLDTCISRSNDRWFLTGLFIFYCYLIFHIYLTFTTVCHVKKMKILFIEILYPSRCPDAYFDYGHSIGTSVGCYAWVLSLYVSIVLIQQIYTISFSKRRIRPNKKLVPYKNNFLWDIVSNWSDFWLR